MKSSYNVAVWATGGVGKYAIRTIADRPNLHLVGVWVHSDSKNGKDAGELAGIDPIGVRATQDESEILNGDADCIVYAAPAPPRMKEAIADLCRILAAGKNIVTTAISGLVYPRGSMPDKVTDAIRGAAEAGRSSLFSSGIEPGFGADLFPIALMSMSHKVYSVRGIEITNYSEYPAEYDMRDLFGFGQPLDYQGGLKAPGTLRWGWGAAVTMVAESLGVELDEIRETC
ncbi:MAG: dihydrodipicolinate reductase, partial [Mycobacterium sp.]|nr:dihydrodipicolinate reductase [Mycobacterium sp.]